MLTGAPIIGALVGLHHRSTNTKTGQMIQAYVLRDDIDPITAVNTGQDDAICGTCPMRSGSNEGRACYVIWWLGPNQTWKASRSYPVVPPALASTHLVGRSVRITAYGDAAAIPFDTWAQLVGRASHHTGYTSQWATCDPRFKLLLMASVQTPAQQAQAAAAGWRTFRSGWQRADPQIEVQCPASAEMGHRTVCTDCALCQGARLQAKSVAIQPHGMRTQWMPV